MASSSVSTIHAASVQERDRLLYRRTHDVSTNQTLGGSGYPSRYLARYLGYRRPTACPRRLCAQR
eukprot:1197926-Rhodomonas_salina.6